MSRKLVWSVATLVVGTALGVAAFSRSSAHAAAEGQGPKGQSRPVPVQVAVARATDVAVALSGLGSVAPSKTVTVKSRVGGQLLRVLFKEGELVEQGQVLAELDPRPFEAQIAQAEGQLIRDRALLENARVELERANALVKESLVSGQQVAAQKSLVAQYQGAERIGEGQLSAARLQLGFTRVTAPIRGRVGFRLIDAGNNITVSDGLAVIHTVEPVTVVFSLPEDRVRPVVRRVREAERSGGQLEVEAWDKQNHELLGKGALLTIDNQIDTATGTVRLKAQFENGDGLLFPSQFVNVRFVVDTIQGAIVVPTAAVQRGRDGPFVYVVSPENVVSIRAVTVGVGEAGQVAIEQGLAAGERVVLQGADQVREGTTVKVLEKSGPPDRTKPAGPPAAARPAP